MTDTLVICGPTCFHAVDAGATALVQSPRGRQLLADLQAIDGVLGYTRTPELAKIRVEFPGVADRMPWEIKHFATEIAWGRWHDGDAIPRCRMIQPGPAITADEGEARGLRWSKECAKALGLVVDGRSPLERVTWSQSRHAYMHAIRCRTCSMSGIGGCNEFHRIATGAADTSEKPRPKAVQGAAA